MSQVVDQETGVVSEVPAPDPEPEPEPTTEPEPEPEARCEAETTVGGTLYRCALNEGHEDEHAFQPQEGAAPPERKSASEQRDVQDALENEAIRHAARLAEIFGAEIQPAKGKAKADERLQEIMAGLAAAGLHACELCPPNFGGWRADAAPNEQTSTRVRAVLGMPDLSNFKPSPTEAICNDCGGLTKVKTGSLDPRFETKVCDGCGGKGYISTRPRLNTTDEPEPEQPVSNGNPSWHDDGVQRDMFGTPITDPDYGLMPALRARPVDYWQTHRE